MSAVSMERKNIYEYWMSFQSVFTLCAGNKDWREERERNVNV